MKADKTDTTTKTTKSTAAAARRAAPQKLHLRPGGSRKPPVGVVMRREFSGLCGVAKALGVGRTTLREALLGRTYSPEIIASVKRYWPQLITPEVAAKYDGEKTGA